MFGRSQVASSCDVYHELASFESAKHFKVHDDSHMNNAGSQMKSHKKSQVKLSYKNIVSFF